MKLHLIFFTLLGILTACVSGPATANLLEGQQNTEPTAAPSTSAPTSVAPSIAPSQIPAFTESSPAVSNTPTIRPLPSPTPTATPVTLELPTVNHDFVYMDKSTGELRRWEHLSSQVETLVGSDTNALIPADGRVVAADASQDGRQYALVMETPSTGFQLVWLDISAPTLTIMAESDERPRMAMSPDGERMAYILSEGAGSLYVIQRIEPDNPVEVGICMEEERQFGELLCGEFLWSPDSRTLAWQDSRGVWLAVPGEVPRQVVGPLVVFEDFLEDEDLLTNYRLESWSPSGRYLKVIRPYFEGATFAILDTTSGQAAELPGGFFYVYNPPSLSWLPDDRLLMATALVQSFDENDQALAGVVIWQVDSVGGVKLTVVEHFPTDLEPCVELLSAGILDNGDFYYLVNSDTSSDCRGREPNGLYLATGSRFGSPQIIEAEPVEFGVNAKWSPDERAVLLDGQEPVLLVSMSESQVYEIGTLLESQVCCFHWVR